MNIDYDKLLDDWAEEIYKKVKKYNEDRECERTGTFKDGYLKGLSEGYISAISMLTCIERKEKRNTK